MAKKIEEQAHEKRQNKVSKVCYRSCNYVTPAKRSISHIVSHYDFMVDEKNQLIVVEIEKEDIDKTVASHADEVGLINIIKLAVAQGLDPKDAPFAKKEPGVTLNTDYETWDEVKKDISDGQEKIDQLCASLGITYDELVKHAKEGTLTALVESKTKEKAVAADEKKDGE